MLSSFLPRAALAVALLALSACGDADTTAEDAALGETTVVSGETDAPVPGRAADTPTEPPTDLAADSTEIPQPVTITELQAGDVACYVTLTDAAGATRNEMANFEICEQTSLVGTPVTIRTEMGNVMAASCQGDPDCPDSESVRLIVEATPATN